MEDVSSVTVVLVEREGTSSENSVTKTSIFNQDDLYMDDVLSVMEQALRGFGFVLDKKHLEIVKDER